MYQKYNMTFLKICKLITWISSTHYFLTDLAIDLVCKNHETARYVYTNEYQKLLSIYSCLPDLEDKDTFLNVIPLYYGHFYDPITQQNYLGMNSDTCKKRFLAHYDNALRTASTDRLMSMMELGKALHYAADVCVPHHSQNKIAFLSNHQSFEKKSVEHYLTLKTLSSSSLSLDPTIMNIEKIFMFAAYSSYLMKTDENNVVPSMILTRDTLYRCLFFYMFFIINSK